MSDGYRGFFAHPIEQWSQFFCACNWRTFNPILIEVEDDRIMGGVEATIILLGVGLRVRWNYAETEAVTDMKEQVEKIDRALGVSMEGGE